MAAVCAVRRLAIAARDLSEEGRDLLSPFAAAIG
jgi:hypothetical protein